jgi:hypothetical protein
MFSLWSKSAMVRGTQQAGDKESQKKGSKMQKKR